MGVGYLTVRAFLYVLIRTQLTVIPHNIVHAKANILSCCLYTNASDANVQDDAVNSL